MSVGTRLDAVEDRLADVTSRLARLEGRADATAVTPPRRPPTPAPAPRPVAPPPAPGPNFEELFGGRVLAWIGGLAIFLGAVLFMAMAIGNGWIDEPTRTVLGLLGSSALLVAGLWLHERRGQTDAAKAAVASAISGLYVTLVVATQVYDLIPAGAGLALGALIAGVALAIAVRWSSQVVAAIGLLGAIAAPVLVGVGATDTLIAFVALALAGSVGVLIWQRWEWLSFGAFAISAPQLAVWVFSTEASDRLSVCLPVLLLFWAIYGVAAFGYELRARESAELPFSSWLLLFGSSALTVGIGYSLLSSYGSHEAAVAWLIGAAAVHVLLGQIALRLGIHDEIGSMLIGVGVALSALGLAAALEGPALVAAWAAEAVALAFLARRAEVGDDESFSSADRLLAVGGIFLGLAAGHMLVFEAPPNSIVEGVTDLGLAAASIAAVALAALAYAWLVRDLEPVVAGAAAAGGAAALVYLGSVLIVDTIGVTADGEVRQAGQVWLSAFWTVTGLGALVWGLVGRIRAVRLGGLALLGIAIAKVWTYDLSELDDVARVLSFLGLGLLLLMGSFAYQRVRPAADERQTDRTGAAA